MKLPVHGTVACLNGTLADGCLIFFFLGKKHNIAFHFSLAPTLMRRFGHVL